MLLPSASSPSFPRMPSRLGSVRFGENYRFLVVEDDEAIRKILVKKIKTTRSNSFSQKVGVAKKDTIEVTGVSSLQSAKDAFEKVLESHPGQRPFHGLITDNDLSQGGESGTNHGIALLKWMQTTIPDLLKPWCFWMHSSGGDDIQQLAKKAGAQKFYTKGNGLQVIGPMVQALWEEIRNKENKEKEEQKAKEIKEKIDNNAFKKNWSFKQTSVTSIWPISSRSKKNNLRRSRRFTR